jgi:uncharacterized protein
VHPSDAPPVRGFLHRAVASSGDGLVLTHGAGSNCNAPLLVAMADLFAQKGVTVLRCDLPFRQRRAYGLPSPGSAAEDQRGLRAAIRAVRPLVSGRVFAGGHSYGGRQTTMLVADEPSVADALLILSYPLHPPQQPTKLRTAHLPRLRTPALFVQGSEDAFASIAEIEAAIRLIPAHTSLTMVNGAGHDLGFARRKVNAGLLERIVDAFQEFVGVLQLSS